MCECVFVSKRHFSAFEIWQKWNFMNWRWLILMLSAAHFVVFFFLLFHFIFIFIHETKRVCEYITIIRNRPHFHVSACHFSVDTKRMCERDRGRVVGIYNWRFIEIVSGHYDRSLRIWSKFCLVVCPFSFDSIDRKMSHESIIFVF